MGLRWPLRCSLEFNRSRMWFLAYLWMARNVFTVWLMHSCRESDYMSVHSSQGCFYHNNREWFPFYHVSLVSFGRGNHRVTSMHCNGYPASQSNQCFDMDLGQPRWEEITPWEPLAENDRSYVATKAGICVLILHPHSWSTFDHY